MAPPYAEWEREELEAKIEDTETEIAALQDAFVEKHHSKMIKFQQSIDELSQTAGEMEDTDFHTVAAQISAAMNRCEWRLMDLGAEFPSPDLERDIKKQGRRGVKGGGGGGHGKTTKRQKRKVEDNGEDDYSKPAKRRKTKAKKGKAKRSKQIRRDSVLPEMLKSGAIGLQRTVQNI